MIESSQLLQTLRINGVTNSTPFDDVDKTLTALKYSPEEKQRAFEILKSQGWGGSEILQPVSQSNMTPAQFSVVPVPIPPTIIAPTPVPPIAPVAPTQPVIKTAQSSVLPPQQSVYRGPVAPVLAPARSHLFFYVAMVIVLVLVLAGGFVFVTKYNLLPFTKTLYTPETFFSSLLLKSSAINSAAYQASFSLKVADRDVGAMPFQVVVTNTAALREQYQNDSERVKDLSSLVSMLRSSGNYNPYPTKKLTQPSATFPSSLQKMVADMTKQNSFYKNTSITDPATNKEYVYQSVDGGKDFKLTMVFETDAAIKAIRQAYGYTATSSLIVGKTVTFSKDSPYYFYLSPEPPKPFLVQIGESMSSLPADVSVAVDVGAQTDFTNSSALANWLAQFNADGSFGDLTYKVNVEARKKDSNYYIRVNNIPSILGSFALLKGKWIEISTDQVVSTSTDAVSNQFDYISKELQSTEKSYKENRQALTTILKKAAEIADEEKLIEFKNTPTQETVDGRSLTRYELQIRKDAILPFYQKLVAEMNKEKTLKEYNTLSDQGLVEYLQSDEFNQVYDYVNQNTQLVFWTDSQGYPAIIEENFRVVPPDTAVQLKGKQVNLIFKLSFNDINTPVNIEAPESSTPISEIMTELNQNQYGYDTSGEAKMKSSLASVRAMAEIVYGKSKNSYGSKPFVLGACKQTLGTMYADSDLFKLIPTGAICVSSGSTGKVESYAVSAPLSSDPTYSWCVDSSGNSKQIKGVIKSSACK